MSNLGRYILHIYLFIFAQIDNLFCVQLQITTAVSLIWIYESIIPLNTNTALMVYSFLHLCSPIIQRPTETKWKRAA